MIIQTSNLGYSVSFYNVDTNATPKQLKEVNFSKLISTHRTDSTTIKQLQNACLKMGFSFTYTPIGEKLNHFPKELDGQKIDYKAHSGNY